MDPEEKQLGLQFRKNWSKMKDEISPRWNVIADMALEKDIIDFDDYERIKSMQTGSDKVEAILFNVIRLKKCTTFYEMLEVKEFERLCKDVKDTVINIEPIQRDQTYTISTQKDGTDPDMSIKEMWSKMEQKFEEARLNQIEGNTRLEQRINESQAQIEKMEKHFDTALAEAKSNYDKLQHAHQYARDNLERLTRLMKDKTLENAELLSQIKVLKDIVEKTKHTSSKDLEEKEKELENLRDKLKQETGILESFKTQIEELKSEKENITAQLTETKSELVQVRSKCDRLEAKSQSDFDDIMKKIDSLTSSHEANVSKQSNNAQTGNQAKNTQTTIPKAQTALTQFGLDYKELNQKRKYNAFKKK